MVPSCGSAQGVHGGCFPVPLCPFLTIILPQHACAARVLAGPLQLSDAEKYMGEVVSPRSGLPLWPKAAPPNTALEKPAERDYIIGAVRLDKLPNGAPGVCTYLSLGVSLSGSNSAVECQLPKLDVAGSIPVSRSIS